MRPFAPRPLVVRAALAAGISLVALATPSRAVAGDNDLVLARLGEINAAGTGVIAHNQDWRSLTSELGVVLAPRFLSPANTIGYAGFQFSAEVAYTSISGSAPWWQATEESSESDTKSDGLFTSGFFVRKGIWLPLPSFELGAGAVNLSGSNLWAGQAYAKFALHEGFHDWPLPSLAIRGAVSRLFGSDQLDLTVASIDGSVSHAFGIAGTMKLEPYLGGNYVIIVPRSEVIDKTANIDAFPEATHSDVRMNFVFATQDNVTRQQLFGGVKLKYYVFSFTAEAAYAFAGSSVDDRSGVTVSCSEAGADPSNCDAEDQAGSQQTFAFSLALDF